MVNYVISLIAGGGMIVSVPFFSSRLEDCPVGLRAIISTKTASAYLINEEDATRGTGFEINATM